MTKDFRITISNILVFCKLKFPLSLKYIYESKYIFFIFKRLKAYTYYFINLDL